MAELRTPGERSQEKPPFDPPARRRGPGRLVRPPSGIAGHQSPAARIPIARILAVVALAAALIALIFVLKAASGSSSTAPTTAATQTAAPTGATTTGTPARRPVKAVVEAGQAHGPERLRR